MRCVCKVNVALLRTASQVSTYETASAAFAVDGVIETVSCVGCSSWHSTTPWWAVDLGKPMDIGRVCVTNDHNIRLGQR